MQKNELSDFSITHRNWTCTPSFPVFAVPVLPVFTPKNAEKEENQRVKPSCKPA